MNFVARLSALICALSALQCGSGSTSGGVSHQDLGSGYYRTPRGWESCILYDARNVGDGGGTIIINPILTDVRYDERYIGVLNMDFRERTRQYWLIDKHHRPSIDAVSCSDSTTLRQALYSNVIGPTDSIGYERLLADRNISLHLSSSPK
jgi:hypothetical protein